jgi:AmmeMemoRadiSam system protein A
VSIDDTSRGLLLRIARGAIAAAVRNEDEPAFEDAPILHEHRGVFVTLTRAGHLRGCIGRTEADEPLSTLLPAMAVMSATGDPRFSPVSPADVPGLHIEISLLTPPVPVSGPGEIEIGRHGLIVTARGRRGLLLPSVATDYGWSAEEFFAQTCIKAGLPADAWREPGARVDAFETETIEE